MKTRELNFKHKTLELKTFTAEQIFNECSIFDIVNKKDLVHNLQNKTTVSKDGLSLSLRKGMIKDEQDRISLVLFGSLMDVADNDKYYEFKKNSSTNVHE